MTKNAKRKEHYDVYLVSTYYGEFGEVNGSRKYVGETWAVSKAQAENNVRFRHEGAKRSYDLHDWGRDTCMVYTYEAVPASGCP